MAKTRPLLNADSAAPRVRSNKGVVLIKNLPLGFFEPQMRKFFEQFGEIARVRISKSRRNGHSKGYGWVEFVNAEVAKIASQSMKNYMLMGKTLTAVYLQPEEIHEDTFRNANRPFTHIPWKKIAVQQSAQAAEAMTENRLKRLIKKDLALKERVRSFNLDYEVPTLADVFPEVAKNLMA